MEAAEILERAKTGEETPQGWLVLPLLTRKVATGAVGWGLGIGRVGAIVGPYIGGELLARQWSTQDMFLAAALPALVSTFAMMFMRQSKTA